MKKNIVLTGFMGAGKSVIAKELEERLGRKSVSTDALIEEREKRSITDIFRDSGEVYFRKVESDIVQEISDKENLIVDCGGGVVLNINNINILKETGIVFYLAANVRVLYERLKDETHRPLLHVDNPQKKIVELLSIRDPFYGRAHHKIDTSDMTVIEAVEEIVKLVNNE